jgi:putative hydrolase of the HAD superfamily
MLEAEVHLLDHVEDTLAALSQSHDLMIITKGDLLDQELKVARSGLADYFNSVEIVSEKTAGSYREILARRHLQPGRFLMVGNSLKSDILPVLAIGARAVYVPQALTWAYEVGMAPDEDQDGYFELEHLGQLPALVEQLSRG